MRANKTSQLGLTIVELMVGLVLGLFLLGGVLHIYIGSSQTYRTTESLSRVQESGRFAVDFLADDLRRAGYKGVCSQDVEVTNHLDEGHEDYDDALFAFNEPLRGWESSAGDYAGLLTNYRANTDVLLVKHAGVASGLVASAVNQSVAAAITLTSASGINQGQILMISNVEGCDIFQNASNPNASNLNRGNPGGAAPGNKNPSSSPFSTAYSGAVEIAEFRSLIYYIGAGQSGLPSLRRIRADDGNVGGSEELVEGVIDMELCYGVDTNQDYGADSYVSADAVADWSEVVAVRMSLLAISPEVNVATEAPAFQYAGCDGAAVNATQAEYPEFGERRLAQVYTSTVALRNRLQ